LTTRKKLFASLVKERERIEKPRSVRKANWTAAKRQASGTRKKIRKRVQSFLVSRKINEEALADVIQNTPFWKLEFRLWIVSLR